jgi:hypothetical protein
MVVVAKALVVAIEIVDRVLFGSFGSGIGVLTMNGWGRLRI